MKHSKIFECDCLDGFTGDFCEFKNQEQLLFFVTTTVSEMDRWPIFDADGGLVEVWRTEDIIGEQSGVYKSCSTILNGEAVIFGGEAANINRQVQ